MINRTTKLLDICISVILISLLVGCDKPKEDARTPSEIPTSGGIVITGAESSDMQAYYDQDFIEAYNSALSREDYVAAENLAAGLVSKKNNDANALIVLGLPQLMQGRFEDAIVNFDKAIELEPRNSTALYNRGFAAWQLGDSESAIRYYRLTLDIDMDFPEAHYGIAAASEKLGLYDQVIEHATRFLELKTEGAFVSDAITMLASAKKKIGVKR